MKVQESNAEMSSPYFIGMRLVPRGEDTEMDKTRLSGSRPWARLTPMVAHRSEIHIDLVNSCFMNST
jgi:hypothetical protein